MLSLFNLKHPITPSTSMENLVSQLTTDNHPFFQNLPQLMLELEPFLDKALPVEGDVFQKCTIAWRKLGFSSSKLFMAAI